MRECKGKEKRADGNNGYNGYSILITLGSSLEQCNRSAISHSHLRIHHLKTFQYCYAGFNSG